MTGRGVRGAGAVLVAMIVAATATACSDDGDSASSTASKAASAASSLASRGTDAVASATAAAGDKLNSIKDGVNASGDVTVGAPDTDEDGRATAKITVRNGTDAARSYAVQINFRDENGNLLDTSVVTVDDVPAKGSKDATARSNRKLEGDVKTEVGKALRH
ncbi:FxLYD domain-containing protein [Streptomyces sp. ITFR-16]|uniref:FxLYD domain-containing protein n=1 Tax=Streptomyces sp. ITFR-16 TaxID=3075198 RepID=UPI002889E114|nr:FxLYD domain-containing protein [Streptomyces sp. ITFR-16]WNI25149.1 FxLYD domain-containing protein [Streptomyces sp. ITFR-16]